MPNPIASTEKRPDSDPRDLAIKSLSAKCREIVELSHQIEAAERRLHEAQYEPVDVDKLTAAASEFGALEERFYNLREAIEAECRQYQQRDHFKFQLVHTASGMPIRVNQTSRVAPWS